MCYMRRYTPLCHVLNRNLSSSGRLTAYPPLDPTHVMLNKSRVSRLRCAGDRISGRVASSDKRIKFIILIIQRFDRRRSRAEPGRVLDIVGPVLLDRQFWATEFVIVTHSDFFYPIRPSCKIFSLALIDEKSR